MHDEKQLHRLDASRRLLERIRQPGDVQFSSVEAPQKKQLFASLKNFPDHIGMEILSGGVIFARVRRSGKPVLESIRFFPFPSGCTAGTAEASSFIARSASSFAHDLSQCRLWCAAPSGLAELHFLRLPHAAGKELDALALLAAKKDQDFDSASHTFDYYIEGSIIEKNVPRLLALGVHAETDGIKKEYASLSSNGLSLFGMTETSLAIRSIFDSKWISSPWKNFILTIFNEETTSCCFFRGTALLMRRTLRTGMKHIVEQWNTPESESSLSSHFLNEDVIYDLGSESEILGDFSLEQPVLSAPVHSSSAERINLSSSAISQALTGSNAPPSQKDYGPIYDRHPSENDEKKLHRRLTPIFSRMGRQIERTSEWFRNTIDRGGVQGIFLLCPEGIASAACSVISQETGLPCFPLRPSGEASPSASAELDRLCMSPQFEAAFKAIALALSSADTPNLLLPPALRRKTNIFRNAALCAAAASLLFCLAAGAAGTFSFFNWRQNLLQIAEQEKLRAAWQEEFTAESLRKELHSLRSVQILGADKAPRRLIAAAISHLSSITPESIHIVSLEFSSASLKKEGTAQGHHIELKGIAYGDELQRETDLAVFFRQLEGTPMFAAVSVSRKGNESFTASIRTM